MERGHVLGEEELQTTRGQGGKMHLLCRLFYSGAFLCFSFNGSTELLLPTSQEVISKRRSLQSVAVMLPPVFVGSLYQKVGEGPVEANIGSSFAATGVKVLGKEQLFFCFCKPG